MPTALRTLQLRSSRAHSDRKLAKSWQGGSGHGWRRVGKAEVDMEVDAEVVEEKLEDEEEEEEDGGGGGEQL